MRGRPRQGFTLIEVMLVVVLIGMMTALVMPKAFFTFDSSLRVLQKTVSELSDLALDGVTVRLRMDTEEKEREPDRGALVAEGLLQVEDANQPGNARLEWRRLKLQSAPDGEDWRLEPGVVYFYSDGTCTPARILWADKAARITDGESALLTVTGYLFEEKKSSKMF